MLLTVNGKVRAGSDPDLRFTPSGIAVSSVRAVASRNKKNDDGTWDTTHELWFTVTAWRKTAEQMAEEVVKGQEFYLLGEIYEEEWESNDGEKRKTIKVIANAISALPPRESSGGGGGQSRPATDHAEEPPF